jgi:parallel beta-helix repeat protein
MRMFYWLTITILFTYTSLIAQALIGNYTVGGSNPDFADISDAVTSLDTNGVSGPVTFELRPGIYLENDGTERVMYIPLQITGASDTNTVTFKPDMASGGTVDNVVLRRVVGSYDETGWIAEIRSDGITLKELTFEYADTSTVGYNPNTSFALVHLQFGSGSSGISDITITGCKLLRTSVVQRSPQGISVTNEASDITITDNLIDGSKDGINMWRGSNIIISGNTILNLLTNVTAVGNWQGYGIRIETAQDDVVIRNNIIDYRNGYGVSAIDIAGNTGSLLIEANQVLNGQNNHWNQRVFYGISYTAGFGQASIINNMIATRSPGAGIYVNAPNCTVTFNTAIQSNSSVARLENGRSIYLGKSGHTVVNNIFINLLTGDVDGGVLQIADTTGNKIDYNCLYKSLNDGQFVRANGVVYDSFINWQASGNGAHSIEKYPEFKNILLDLHLTGCSIYDPDLQAALVEAAIQFDLDGDSRDLNTPFFGMDEAEGTLPEIFTNVAITPTNDEALHFTSADLDGDGDNDLAVVNLEIGSGDVSLFWNDGAANFSGPNHISFGNIPEVIKSENIDDDNVEDLFTTSEGKLTVRYGSGSGNFDTEVEMPYQSDVEDFLFVDLDNDDDLDIFQTHAGIVGVNDGEVTQLINLGSRNFTYANLGSFNAGQYPSAAAFGFINDDTFIDVAVVDFINGSVAVLLNLGTDDDGFWLGFESGGDYPVSSGSSPLHANLSLGDIDGDDHVDILVGVWGISSEGLALLRNKGDGTFSPKEDFFIDENRYSETFSLLDYEGDSDLDLIVATQYHDLIFFRNDGFGNFEQFLLCYRSELGGEPLTLLTAPLDGDLLPDIAVLTITDDIVVMSNLDYVSEISKDDALPGMVETFRLHQNFPNPFNPVTVINYQIATVSHITLTVFDVLGRKVKVLIDEPQMVGDYSVSFDASALASGVYVYNLKAGAFEQSRKMILLR